MITWLLLTPLFGLVTVLAAPARYSRMLTLAAQTAGPFLVLAMVLGFDRNSDYQFLEQFSWIPSLGVDYSVGVDGISLLLVFLAAATGFLATLAGWTSITYRVKEYHAMLLLLQSAMYGVFVARDLMLFFVFFEFTLVPMYFLIGIWGGERRLYAAIKFLLYTLAGSVLMLIGILALYFAAGATTFDAETLLAAKPAAVPEEWIFWTFFIAFAVKTPMVPFHTWLPDAHTEAPTAGSVLLASVLLKMGTYGMLRFALPLLPHASNSVAIVRWLAILSIVAILYGALVSLVQQDWKRLVAYSSVSHLGFCTLGIFSMNTLGLTGSILQQVNHGISTGMLFLLVGIVYDQRHTRKIADFGGLAHRMPHFATLFAIAMFSSAGLPLLNGFIGEFTILSGAFQASRAWAYWSVPGIVFGAAYLLWLYQRTMLGPLTPANASVRDLNAREWLMLAPLAAWAILIGVYPSPYFELLERPVAALLEGIR